MSFKSLFLGVRLMITGRLAVLSEQEIRAIHDESLKVLADTGVCVWSPRVLGLLRVGGASVDMESQRARLPKELVDRCLSSLPSSFVLYDRLGRPAFEVGKGRTFCASGHNAVFILENEQGERRPITKEEVGKFARLADALPNIDFVGIQAMPQDVLPEASLLHAAEITFQNTCKHVFFSPESAEVARAILRMAECVVESFEPSAGTGAASRESGSDEPSPCSLSKFPVVTCQLSPTSPLFWETGAVEAVWEVAERGVPLCLLPQPFTGVSSPYTLSGTLLIHNAEILSGIVISQLVRRGTPVIYGSAWTTFDMRESNVLISRPEAALMRIAGAQLAAFYHIPSHTIGPDSDSHVHDEQNGWEKLLTGFTAVMSGVDMLVNAGMFATGMTVSFEQLVLDDEMLGILQRIGRGIEITPQSLGGEAIRRVGPRGSFLTDDHTLEYLRTREHLACPISAGTPYDVWVSRGQPTAAMTARARTLEILESHKVKPLPGPVQEKLRQIVREFENLHSSRGAG